MLAVAVAGLERRQAALEADGQNAIAGSRLTMPGNQLGGAAAGAVDDLGGGHRHPRRDVGQVVRLDRDVGVGRVDAGHGGERIAHAVNLGGAGRIRRERAARPERPVRRARDIPRCRC